MLVRGFAEVFYLSMDDLERVRGAYPELREVLTMAWEEKSATVAGLVLEGVVL